MVKITLFVLTPFLINVHTAPAYLDPESGSAIMIMIIGFFVAIGAILKTFWYKVKSIFRFSQNKEKDIDNKQYIFPIYNL